MMPILFNLGPFNVYSFGLFLALSFVLSTFVIYKYAKDELKEEEYLDVYLYTSIVLIFSSRLVYIILNFEKFKFNIMRYFLVAETPGLSLTGGLILAILFLLWYVKKKKYDFWHLADLLSITFSYALVLVKIGEQLGGAAFGKMTNFYLAVRIAGQSGRYHPTEFYEALIFLFLGITLTILYKKLRQKKMPDGVYSGFFLTVFSLQTFLLEFIKNSNLYLYGLGFRQIISIIVLGMVLLVYRKKFKESYLILKSVKK